MNNDQERAEFELARDRAYRTEPGTFDAWDAWQARAALQKRGIPECAWVYDDLDTYSYDTSCGHLFTIMDGTLEENSMKFCCFCGGSIVAEECDLTLTLEQPEYLPMPRVALNQISRKPNEHT